MVADLGCGSADGFEVVEKDGDESCGCCGTDRADLVDYRLDFREGTGEEEDLRWRTPGEVDGGLGAKTFR